MQQTMHVALGPKFGKCTAIVAVSSQCCEQQRLYRACNCMLGKVVKAVIIGVFSTRVERLGWCDQQMLRYGLLQTNSSGCTYAGVDNSTEVCTVLYMPTGLGLT
jgi:hypothetical protein